MKSQTSLIDIVNNEEGLYEGTMLAYTQSFMYSRGLTNPYHNLRHALHTMWECYDGGVFHKLSPDDLRSLIIGGFKHDENHSGKIRGRDAEEVDDAITSVRATIQPEDVLRLPNIESLLRATQFPYVIPEEELTISQQIIRDADMSQNFSPVWVQQSWIGLSQEMGMVNPLKLLRMRPKFLESIKFHSEWGKQKFEPRRLPAIEEAYGHIKMFIGEEESTSD